MSPEQWIVDEAIASLQTVSKRLSWIEENNDEISETRADINQVINWLQGLEQPS